MNLFRSVFSDEPDPSPSESNREAPTSVEEQETLVSDSSSNEQDQKSTVGTGGGWSFGGLVQTLATKSESVIEIYRRDLQEFKSWLKKEIEGAQGSLESVGHTIDEIGSSVLKGTARIISQSRESILSVEHDSDSSDTSSSKSYSVRRGLNSKGYSRFDAQVRLIQGDTGTYCEEPDDLTDYSKWKSGFVLEETELETERMLAENSVMKSIYERVVPDIVGRETFWSRYFYKVHKLKQAEHMRANLVKRAISREDEEELSWDVDDDDDDDAVEEMADSSKKVSEMKLKGDDKDVKDDVRETESDSSANIIPINVVEVPSREGSIERKDLGAKDSAKVMKEETLVEDLFEKKKEAPFEGSQNAGSNAAATKDVSAFDVGDNDVSAIKETSEPRPDKQPNLDSNAASGDSSGEFSVVSNQAPVQEEEDLGWDEIEDLSGIDDKKVNHTISSPKRAELRKRLSATEEEEDLSWDIEDDDDPIKT